MREIDTIIRRRRGALGLVAILAFCALAVSECEAIKVPPLDLGGGKIGLAPAPGKDDRKSADGEKAEPVLSGVKYGGCPLR